MAIDPNIPLQAGKDVPQLDVLGTMGKVQTLQNAQLQNKLGTVDLATKEQGLGARQRQALGSTAFGLMHLPDAQLVPELHNALDQLVASNMIPRQMGQMFMDNAAKSGDVARLRQMIHGVYVSTLGPEAQSAQVYGTPSTMQTGGTNISGVTAPARAGGAFIGSSVTPNTLSPASQTELVDVPVMVNGQPTGQTEKITRAELATRTGRGDLVTGRAASGGTAFSPGFTGRPAAPAPAAPAAAPPQQALAPSGGSFGQTVAPAAATATVANATAGAGMGNALIQQADTVPNQRAIIGEMEAALDKFTTGKGQQAKLNMQGYVQSMAPGIARAFNIDPKAIASAETFNKLAQQIMLLQGSSLGLGTDASRAALFGGNPNMDLSKLGNSTILKIMHGNADSVEAKAAAWRQSPEYGTGDYSGFSTKFNKGFDPRVYQWAHLDSAERAAMLAGSSKDRDALIQKILAKNPR